MQASSCQRNTERGDALLTHENIDDLARIMTSEAGGEGEAAQAMVGWIAVNRIKKDGLENVFMVWTHGNFAHGQMPTDSSLYVAERILSGGAKDISHGATHFYSPKSMPKEGDPCSQQFDIGGGLESVAGVMRAGRPVRNYRPGWAKHPSPIRIAGIEDKDFKFYRL